MAKRWVVILMLILASLLIATNLAWFLAFMKIAQRENVLIGNLQGTEEALGISIATIKELGKSTSAKQSLLTLYQEMLAENYRADGDNVSAGVMRLQFDAAGKLVDVKPKWQLKK